jgi:hypothetical protein
MFCQLFMTHTSPVDDRGLRRPHRELPARLQDRRLDDNPFASVCDGRLQAATPMKSWWVQCPNKGEDTKVAASHC